MLNDSEVQAAVREAFQRTDSFGSLAYPVKIVACEVGGFEPHELQAWIDSHSSEEICGILL